VLIELVDGLRCPRPHDETWLVAAAERTEGRDIMDGTLGCPVCRAEYPIRGGVVWFDPPDDSAGATPNESVTREPEVAMQLAAFLDLSDAQGFALLTGSWALLAQLLRDIVAPHLVLLNPTPSVAAGNGISVLHIRAGIPLAEGTCRGVALDAGHADATHLDAAVRVLRARGRLVAPVAAALPSGVTELVRDDRLWVAERAAGPPKLVTLRARGS
jgi:uncharacterized protein YbaR (Trm112 family)